MHELRGERADGLAQRQAVWQAVHILTDGGHSLSAISRVLSLDHQTVKRYRAMPGPPTMPGPPLWARCAEGRTVAEIAELLDVDPRTVGRWLAADRPPCALGRPLPFDRNGHAA